MAPSIKTALSGITQGNTGDLPPQPPNDSNSVGGGYGYGSSGPSAKEKQGAANLGAVSGYNQGTILGDAANQGQIYDVADQQNRNLAAIQTNQARRNAGNDWYTQQQKLQSVTSQLRDAMGNAANGSGLYDLWDTIARKDDMDDVAVLNQLRENRNSIDNNLWESLMASNNSRNQTAAETERALREIGADYAAQINNINPELEPGLYNTDGHTINLPDWMKQSFFNDNKRAALNPTEQGFVRPDNAAPDAWNKGLLTGQKNTAQSANQTYQERMARGYNRRTQ